MITLRWKISLHTAAVAGLAMLVTFLFGWPALGLFAIVPLVAWARVRLCRHTTPQTIAGALLGATVAGIWLSTVPF